MNTKEEIRAYVEESCYDVHGMLDRDMLRHVLERYAAALPPEDRWGLYGWTLYNPSKDLRLKYPSSFFGDC